MKVTLIIIFLIGLQFSGGGNCLETNDLCHLVYKKCTGRYSTNSLAQKYKTVCQYEKCHHSYAYNCEYNNLLNESIKLY